MESMNRRHFLFTSLLGMVACTLPATAADQVRPADSSVLQRELQQLSWNQFRSVIEAVPKLRAEVEAYGPLGWEFVKTKYRSHGWKKNIDRLDVAERQQLLRLIDSAKKKTR
jgi:hypothetical protein